MEEEEERVGRVGSVLVREKEEEDVGGGAVGVEVDARRVVLDEVGVAWREEVVEGGLQYLRERRVEGGARQVSAVIVDRTGVVPEWRGERTLSASDPSPWKRERTKQRAP